MVEQLFREGDLSINLKEMRQTYNPNPSPSDKIRDSIKEGTWVYVTIRKAQIYKKGYDKTIENAPLDRQIAYCIAFELEYEWYKDWSPWTIIYAARQFKQSHPMTNLQFYDKLLADDSEPWMSINGWIGSSVSPVDPRSGDIKAGYYYDIEYPLVGYLVQVWFPIYGNNPQRYGSRVTDFKARIEHGPPNPFRIKDRVVKNVEDTVQKIEENVSENKGYLIAGSVAILGIAALYPIASIVSDVKR